MYSNRKEVIKDQTNMWFDITNCTSHNYWLKNECSIKEFV